MLTAEGHLLVALAIGEGQGMKPLLSEGKWVACHSTQFVSQFIYKISFSDLVFFKFSACSLISLSLVCLVGLSRFEIGVLNNLGF